MQYERLKAKVIKRLEEGLSKKLYYHSVRHTLDVISVCEVRSNVLGLSKDDETMLLTAAVLHDAGFLNTTSGHEAEGVEIAKKILPELEYSDEQIDKIAKMILSTKIPQSPETLLEKIICDADLDYLGRDDFYTIGNTLFRELKELGVVSTEEQWDALQIKFLSAHMYHTTMSIEQRGPVKEKYLKELRKKWN